MNRQALVQYAEASMAKGSKSFAAASNLFDRETRERVWLLYAWCRACDDMIDGQESGHAATAGHDMEAALVKVRALTDKAFAGEETGEPAFDALAVVASECIIPRQFADDVIAGFSLDAEEWRPQTQDDLLQYCYHVAGAVGLMMAMVMGVNAEEHDTLDRACDLGLAFQLANIARDVGDDTNMGRCYLPAEWLEEVGILKGEQMQPENRQKLAILGKRLADMAEGYEASARVGAAELPFAARWAVLAAAGIYGDIAREVRSRGERAWDSRVSTSKISKLGWIAKARFQASIAPKPAGRDGLWIRPKSR